MKRTGNAASTIGVPSGTSPKKRLDPRSVCRTRERRRSPSMPVSPKHFLTRHGWVAFPHAAPSFLSVLGTVPGCLLALTFEASSQPPFDKQGRGGVLSRSLTATKQTLRHRTRHPNRLLDTPPVAKGASGGIGRTKPGKTVVGVLVVWRAVFMAGVTLSTPAGGRSVGGRRCRRLAVCWSSGGVLVVCRPAAAVSAGGGVSAVWWSSGGVLVVCRTGAACVRGQTRKGGAAGRPPLFLWCGRRCPTLPHPGGCSTIGAGSLSFRVRKGRSGRVPAAMTAATRSRAATPRPAGGVWGSGIA